LAKIIVLSRKIQCYWLNNWISHWRTVECWVFIGHLWCKIHCILHARATNTILPDYIHWKPAFLFACS